MNNAKHRKEAENFQEKGGQSEMKYAYHVSVKSGSHVYHLDWPTKPVLHFQLLLQSVHLGFLK